MTTRTGAREACDTCPRLTFNEVGEDGTRRCAECLLSEDPRYTAPSPLSTAGYIANGGFVFPGQTWKPASTGTNKSKIEVKKDKSFTTEIPKQTRIRPATTPEKPITGGRVISEGLYKFGDTLARVKKSANGNLYALVKNQETGAWDYEGKAPLKDLDSSDRITGQEAATPVKLTEGFYKYGAGVAEVVTSNRGFPYANILDVHTGRWNYAKGVVSTLKPEDRLTLEEAAQLGKKWERCMCCGKELTNPDSIARGIGPVCAGKL